MKVRLAVVLCVACGGGDPDPDRNDAPDAAALPPDAAAAGDAPIVIDAPPLPPDATPGPPVFLKPDQPGTTLDLRAQACVVLDILVADPDTVRVNIREGSPPIQGGMLSQTSDVAAVWQWCPTSDQIAYTDKWTLRLTAEDSRYPAVTLTYAILLKRP